MKYLWLNVQYFATWVWLSVAGAGAAAFSVDMALRVAENGNGWHIQFLVILFPIWGLGTLGWCFWKGFQMKTPKQSLIEASQ